MLQRGNMSPLQATIFAILWVAFFVFICTHAIYQHPEDKLAPIWISYFLVFTGLFWYSFSTTIPKWIFAILEIAAGTVSNYHQLTQQLAKESQYGYYDRLTFILAGTAVIAKGFQDLFEAPSGPWGNKSLVEMQATSRSNESSATPTPDSPAPEAGTQEHH
jgi:hypothetical protein